MIESYRQQYNGNWFSYRVRTGVCRKFRIDYPHATSGDQHLKAWCVENLPCPSKTRWTFRLHEVRHPNQRYNVDDEYYGHFQTFNDALTFALMWYAIPEWLTD